MSVRLLVNHSVLASASPYGLVDDRNRELAWVNEFLDAQKLRQLSVRSPCAPTALTWCTRPVGSRPQATS